MKKSRHIFSFLLMCICVLSINLSITDNSFLTASALSYQYFENPTAIAADDNALYVADMNAISTFSHDGATKKAVKNLLAGNASAMYVYDSIAYTVENGDIYNYDFKTDAIGAQLLADGSFEGIYVDENYLYVSKNANVIIYERDTLAYQKQLFGSNGSIKGFSVVGEQVYAIVALNAYRSNIIVQNASTLSSDIVLENLPIHDIYALSNSNTIAVLHSDTIKYYSSSGLGYLYETASYAINDIVKICAYENVFALSGAKSIISIDTALSGSSEILAYRSSAHGFFDNPCDITTRFGKVYIADKGNNRVAVRDNDGYHELKALTRPVAVTLNGDGNVIVAHSENKLASFDGIRGILLDDELATVEQAGIVSDLNLVISDIKFDARDNLFLTTRSLELFVKKAGTANFVAITSNLFDSVYAIDVSGNELGVFILAQKNGQYFVVRIDFDTDGTLIFTNLGIDSTDAIDISLDAEGSIYLLKPLNLIERYSFSNGSYNKVFSEYVTGEAELSKLAVSTIDNDFVKFRELLALDSAKNILKLIDNAFLGNSYTKPDSVESLPQSYKNSIATSAPLIRTIIREGGANIYMQSSEVSPYPFVLPQDFKVIVPHFDATQKFTKVICDNVSSSDSDIIVGYVNTSHLSDALKYEPSPSMYCRVWLPDVKVYSLPSRQAPIIEGYESIAKDERLELISFVHTQFDSSAAYGYIDNFPQAVSELWYRVRVLSNNIAYEGFVKASTVTVSNAAPDPSIRPQANAEIIAKRSEPSQSSASIYYLDEKTGEYTIDLSYGSLAVGTKVEVVGAFDPNEKYTKILFYYLDYGTVEVYVETENIDYYGVNVMQIVAIAVICFVTILILFLLYKRRATINKAY